MNPPACEHFFPAKDYDLEQTLTSGQAFDWERDGDGWTAVVRGRWVRLQQHAAGLEARTAVPQENWDWLADYLQIHVELEGIVASFPRDAVTREAIAACHGLRLLRQQPWECLAQFILSSTKQIIQIRQVAATLRHKFGDRVDANSPSHHAFAFPTAARLACASEAELRACKMGFRAPYLLQTARLVANGSCDLDALGKFTCAEARPLLMNLPGVGEKIADCVLLFAYGFPDAFPVDVWVERVLRRHFWPTHRGNLTSLRRRAVAYFGPHAGYAQQYLFHYIRSRDQTERPSPITPVAESNHALSR